MTRRCFPQWRKSLNIETQLKNELARLRDVTGAGLLPGTACGAVWWLSGWKVVPFAALSWPPVSGSLGTRLPTSSCWKGPKAKTTVVKGTKAGLCQEQHTGRSDFTGWDSAQGAGSPLVENTPRRGKRAQTH